MLVTDLRVALFTGNYNYVRDGANQALNRLVEYLLRHGAAVRIYSPKVKLPAFDHVGDLIGVPAIPLPGRAVIYGMWLVPAVLGALIVRKPGAAFYTLSLASLASVAIGTSWGWTIAVQGPLEALGAELGFAIFAYRVYRLPVALLAATLAGVVASALA